MKLKEIIKDKKNLFVVFSKEGCGLCEHLTSQLEKVGIAYAEYAPTKAESKDLKIQHLPRTIIFNQGKEVGRFLASPPADVLKDIKKEVDDTGRYLSDPGDAEEVSLFYQKVIDALKINWRGMNGDEKSKTADMVMDRAHSIISDHTDWSILTPTRLEALI